MKRKIVLTGGHLTPALATIEELKSRKDWEIFYFGRKYNFEGKKIISEEYLSIPKTGAKFINITTGRLQRKFTRFTFLSLIKIPFGLFQSLIELIKIKPVLVLSFGSYVSVPVVFLAWLLKIPVVSHEQTTTKGLASKINSFFSSKIAVSFPESLTVFPKFKTVLTGLPIRNEIFSDKKDGFLREIDFIAKKTGLPLLYITGGNQGAQIINQNVWEILPKLLEQFLVIHQTGKLDYQNALSVKEGLTEKLQERYCCQSFIPGGELGWIFKNAQIIVSRAGANICWELACLGKPAILIPLPFTQANEQLKNALKLDKGGLVKIIRQAELNPEVLLKSLAEINKERNIFLKRGQILKKEYSRDGAEKLVDLIYETVERRIE